MCVKICPSSRRDQRGCACAPTPTRSSSTRVRCQTPNGKKERGEPVGNGGSAERHHGNKNRDKRSSGC
ncbi:hypothetical protein PO909_032951 [Leuciscus waleckii]